jgi:hypothetical protein
VAILAWPESREIFKELTRAAPYAMGMAKVALLGTMGELFGGRIVSGVWRLRGIRIGQRVVVWAVLGAVFTAVFPLFAAGTSALLEMGLLPGAGSAVLAALWTSILMNLLFGFEMMTFHRVTDMLIDRGRFVSRWPLSEVFAELDWRNLLRVPGASLVWFWIPAHTMTFLLPPEFRVICAALLAIALGAILGFARRISMRKAALAEG